MALVFFLFGSAFLLAAAAGFFSVVGLATTYGGAFSAIVALGCTIELGKLVAVSFLYRFWNKIGMGLRAIMSFMVIGVMVVTSLGVFGFLTKANQTDMIGLKQTMVTQQLLVDEEQSLADRKKQIDQQIAQLPTTSVTGRVRLFNQFKQELAQINGRLPEIAKQKAQLAQAQIQQQADIGPLVFIAKALGYDVDIATTWFTLLLVIVFDPLAILLTISANIALAHREKDQLQYAIQPKEFVSSVNEQAPTVAVSTPSQQPAVAEENNASESTHDTWEAIAKAIASTTVQPPVLPKALPDETSMLDFASMPDIEHHSPILVPIFKDRVTTTTEHPDTKQLTSTTEYKSQSVDATDRILLESDWNHYVNKKLKTADEASLQEKIEQLKQYVKELDEQTTLTDDETILKNRILNFVDRHQRVA